MIGEPLHLVCVSNRMDTVTTWLNDNREAVGTGDTYTINQTRVKDDGSCYICQQSNGECFQEVLFCVNVTVPDLGETFLFLLSCLAFLAFLSDLCCLYVCSEICLSSLLSLC